MTPVTSILQIDRDLWQALRPDSSPFHHYDFLLSLEESGSIGPEAGWVPLYFVHPKKTGILYSFLKTHSYGEYIFDWSWAQAFERSRIPYYPKLTSMIPFTPATTPHFLVRAEDVSVKTELLEGLGQFYQHSRLSSSHFLFTTEEETLLLETNGYFKRSSLQYHFENKNYQSFEDFLTHLKTKKAKTLRSERAFPNLSIKRFTGSDLTREHAKSMYQFYLSTIDHKHAIDYLKESFFTGVFERLKNQVLYVEAASEGSAVAGALYFFSDERLYGRYWGAKQEIRNLHFELCYYQGIEFSIERGFKVFEAGAQGEHKIARGFKPTLIRSAHKIKHPEFSTAIRNFVQAEADETQQSIDVLTSYLPFRD